MNMRISAKIWILSGLSMVLFAILSIVAYSSVTKLDDMLNQANEKRYSIDAIRSMQITMAESRAHLFRAMQHDPKSPQFHLHDHPVTRHTDGIKKGLKDIDETWSKYMESAKSPEESRLAEEFKKSFEVVNTQGFMVVVSQFLDGKWEEGSVFALKKVNAQYEAAFKNLNELMEQIRKDAHESNVAGDELSKSITILVTTLSIVGIILLFIGSFVIVRSIQGRLHFFSDSMQSVANTYDLGTRVNMDGSDEIVEATKSFNHLMEVMQETLRVIVRGSESVYTSSERISRFAVELGRSVDLQTTAATSTAAATEEITVSINHVSDNANTARILSEESNDGVERGMHVTEQNNRTMVSIGQHIEEVSNRMARLNQQSQQITQIVGSIREIADQTNLLALNAAIEAARAGDTGRGFAVVADEVRKLAENTGKETGNISRMLTGIQSDIADSANEIRESAKLAEDGQGIAAEVIQMLHEVQGRTRRSMEEISAIADASREQASASNGIAQNMERIADMNEETHRISEDARANALELKGLSESLQSAVSRFKI